jgi:hydroxypyruvate reductase
VIGFGKAVLSMALGVVDVFGDYITDGLLITKHFDIEKQVQLPDTIRVVKGNHPVPGDDSFRSTVELIKFVETISVDDLVLTLISGGGSALCSAPVAGISQKEMEEVTRQLLACGAEIQEMNAVRKHLDRLKGGGLAELLQPADVIAFILSDVIDSPLDVIASGPLVTDPSTYQTVSEIFSRYDVWNAIPGAVKQVVDDGVAGQREETPKAGAGCFDHVQIVLVADNRIACQTAVDFARQHGFNAHLMTSALNGEAREVGRVLSSLIKQIRKYDAPFQAPACLVFGGETTVTLRGTGVGGRNQELALGAVAELAGLSDVLLVTLATDGEDGPTDAAGAWVTGETFEKAKQAGVSVTEALNNNNSYPFFTVINQIVHTGPSGTNVNDLTLCFIF